MDKKNLNKKVNEKFESATQTQRNPSNLNDKSLEVVCQADRRKLRLGALEELSQIDQELGRYDE
ncbi:hypothetical protein COR52_27135 [Vibrio mediterranei]|uniref:Uncharacterized protein n=1 Tax=Vibrio mediterranei TaxID=689 RepID=A0ABX5D6N6_9VIBR|nr:hypothetical protein COR52_27135 [Vibrio mediterranei]PRQ64607.1 hypothetical protein COR51_26660 [Vibrio mediterranei]